MVPDSLDMPHTIAKLPIDPVRKVPVPKFVEWVDGKPDFRIMNAEHWRDSVNLSLCWVCGQRKGRWHSFVSGPMCGVNRISAEPPSHRECAIWSAENCPFLAQPHRRRRESQLPEGTHDPGGVMLRRNPGVAMVWITKSFEVVQAGDGYICQMGPPEEVLWFREGRRATRAEVEESVRTGLPALEGMAREEGPRAVQSLARMVEDFQKVLPAA